MHKFYIGNIEWTVTEEELRSKIDEIGESTFVRIIKDKDTGRSRGFGFFGVNAHPNAVLERLNSVTLNGRQVIVREHQPNDNTPRSTDRSERRGPVARQGRRGPKPRVHAQAAGEDEGCVWRTGSH